jgi:exopolysaccharide biosynthesis polyprenyl glycosylphosphotransferase
MIPSFVNGIIWGAAGLSLAWAIYEVLKRYRSDNLSLTEKAAMPFLKYEMPVANPGTQEKELYRKPPQRPSSAPVEPVKQPARGVKHNPNEAFEALLPFTAILGDFGMILLGFLAATLLCQNDLISRLTVAKAVPISVSYKLLLALSAIVLWGLKGKGLYTYRSLLNPPKIWHKLIGAMAFCYAAFAGISLLVQTDPPVTPLLILLAALITCAAICGWRTVFSRIIRHPALSARLRRRLIVIGGGAQTMRIKEALGENSDMEFVGWVQAIKPNHVAGLDDSRLGPLHELRNILRTNEVKVAVLTEAESLQREGVLAVAKACEIEHVQFEMVPHFFEILVSGVRPENIGGMQLLGVGCLPLYGFRNRFMKRSMDIVGGLAGLMLSIPVMVVFGALVYSESPGPIFYRQIRQGRNGRLFYILKLRSMRMNAEADGAAKWAEKNDSRRLRIGAFMRKWNIDEVPQFWNVLRGQMSLVGPRPERPELIAHFKSKIPHYQARHMYQPGMTGWAQVNGWRGNTCLEERIRHDIWYLENWTIWLDLRIMLQTFFKQKNAY